jgi:hypothetical protein
MDSFDFFDGCDARLADRDGDGKLRGFPLVPLPVAGYTRLHPDWPDQETVDHNIRTQVRNQVPAGTSREITGWLATATGTVYCGYSNTDLGHRHSFTEDEDQVRWDIGGGYPYVVTVDGRLNQVMVVNDALHVEGTPIQQIDLRDWTASAEPWSVWWELCVSDAAYYRDQRRRI